MIKINELKEINKIKKDKYYSSILIILPLLNNKYILLSNSGGKLNIYDSKPNFEEKLIVHYTKQDLNNKNNEISHISLSKQDNNILITFPDFIKCISIYEENQNMTSDNNYVLKYKEIFSISLGLKDFCFYQSISLITINNQIVSSCVKEIIHSWINEENENNSSKSYRVKKVISVCRKDSSSYLLEAPYYKVLITCSFRDKIIKFFDLTNNYKLLSKIEKVGTGYYEGYIALISFNLIIVTGNGIDGMYLINVNDRQIFSKIELNGFKAWGNYICKTNYEDSNIYFLIGCEYKDEKKNYYYNFREYKISEGDLTEIGNKDKTHEEKISSIIFYDEEKKEGNKKYLWSSSKLDVIVWEV